MVNLDDRVSVSSEKLAEFCKRRGIRRLALFGSVLRDDFRQDSDVDVLAAFQPDRTPGFFALFDAQTELSALLGGRSVDLRTPEDLSPHFRAKVLAESHVLYGD